MSNSTEAKQDTPSTAVGEPVSRVEAIADALAGKAAEGEEDARLLDHNYDGIQEFDNPLPGWWSFLLWVCFLFSPFYAVYVHGADGRTAVDEYNAEAQEIAAAQAAEAMKHPVTDESLATLAKDKNSIAVGANIFASKCVTCHEAQGQGKIGPNLTDDYWIHGDAPTAIYTTISKGGRPGTGMKAWEKELGPTELRKVAAFVLTLRGTNPPNPKGPEGTLVE